MQTLHGQTQAKANYASSLISSETCNIDHKLQRQSDFAKALLEQINAITCMK